MEAIQVGRIAPELAAQLLAGCEGLDPRGCTSADDIAEMTARGQCFIAAAQGAQAVYVVQVLAGTAWISAAKGIGQVPWADFIMQAVEAQAKGCRAVAFQTKRRGLMRKALRQGYKVAGWILKKELHDPQL